jgi:hypothetical protein
MIYILFLYIYIIPPPSPVDLTISPTLTYNPTINPVVSTTCDCKDKCYHKKDICVTKPKCDCPDTEVSLDAYTQSLGPATAATVISIGQTCIGEARWMAMMTHGFSMASYLAVWMLNAELQAIKCPEHRNRLLAKIEEYKEIFGGLAMSLPFPVAAEADGPTLPTVPNVFPSFDKLAKSSRTSPPIV